MIDLKVKTRYTTKEVNEKAKQINEDEIKIIFDEPQARITPGQSLVMYIDDIVVGGGKIENTL